MRNKKTQQGSVLLIVLVMLMAFGALVISVSQRQEASEQAALGHKHNSSLEAAIYAAAYLIEAESQSQEDSKNKSSTQQACEAVFNGIANRQNTYKNREFNADTQVYWSLTSFNKNCDDDNVLLNLKAWRGIDADNPVQLLTAKATLNLVADGSSSGGGGLGGALADVFGNQAAVTSGKLNLIEGAKVIGNTTAKETNLSGGTSISGAASSGEITLSGGANIHGDVISDNISSSGGSGYHGNQLGGHEDIDFDPLGLQAAVQNSVYKDSSGNELSLLQLPTSNIKML